MKLATMSGLVLALGLTATVAHAETADEAFQRGQAALNAGRVHEACQAFEASEAAAAKVDTELALASCDEQDGKIVAAAKLYRQLAQSDPNVGRRASSGQKADALEARAAKLRIILSQRPDGLVIKVDGVEVAPSGDVMVDAGPHEVVATAPGFEGHASAAVDRDRLVVDVIIRMEPKDNPPPTTTTTPPPTTTTTPPPTTTTTTTATAMTPATTVTASSGIGHDHRKRNGIIIGAVGVGMLVGSVVLVAEAYSNFDSEHTLCPKSRCATQADLNQANSLESDGHAYRDIGYPLGIVGLAAVGAGAYLMLSGKAESQHVSLDLGRERAGVVFSARF